MGAEELRLLDNAEFALELNCTPCMKNICASRCRLFWRLTGRRIISLTVILQAGYRTDFILEISSAIICFR